MANLQLPPGSLLANRFEIERAAGSGGMGTVYCARFSEFLDGENQGIGAWERAGNA